MTLEQILKLASDLGIDALRREAEKLGVVIEDEAIARGQKALLDLITGGARRVDATRLVVEDRRIAPHDVEQT